MNQDELLKLRKSGEFQHIGLGRAAAYQSLKSEKSRKNSE